IVIGRLYENACALLGSAHAASLIRRPGNGMWQDLIAALANTAHYLNGSEIPSMSTPDAGDWKASTALDDACRELRDAGVPVEAARLWALYWLTTKDEGTSLRIPVALVRDGHQ